MSEHIGWLSAADQAQALLRASGHIHRDAVAIIKCLHEAGYEIVTSTHPASCALDVAKAEGIAIGEEGMRERALEACEIYIAKCAEVSAEQADFLGEVFGRAHANAAGQLKKFIRAISATATPAATDREGA